MVGNKATTIVPIWSVTKRQLMPPVVRSVPQKMTQWWRQMLDLTYPVTSMFSGRDFNTTIQRTFGETHLEDLWLPYFTISTDITDSCMRVHTHGTTLNITANKHHF
uniref:PNPLA domain-containing protein n=2 Tax=Timema TaxID=61471 RepID=A0A7R9ILR0_9NEOP|nr:unnamed protein product [Timema bartmani]CAD7460762.1 unnamed protein product [Timema tahoe]